MSELTLHVFIETMLPTLTLLLLSTVWYLTGRTFTFSVSNGLNKYQPKAFLQPTLWVHSFRPTPRGTSGHTLPSIVWIGVLVDWVRFVPRGPQDL